MHHNTPTLYVAIDIGKNVHWLGTCGGFELKPVMAVCKLRSNRAGFAPLSQRLDAWLSDGAYDSR